MVRAGASDEDSAGSKHLQGSEIEFLVAAQGGVEVALGFGEGGRVEDDGVVAMAGVGVVLEQVEGVGFDPLNLLSPQELLVRPSVLLGDLEGCTGTIDSGYLGALRGKIQSKGSLIT